MEFKSQSKTSNSIIISSKSHHLIITALTYIYDKTEPNACRYCMILRWRWRRRLVEHLTPVIVHARRGHTHLLLTRVHERVRERSPVVRRWRPEHGRPHVEPGGQRRGRVMHSDRRRRGRLLRRRRRKSRVLRVPSDWSVGSEK